MIPVLSREESRALDEDAVERLGVSGIVLMENAGRGATRILVDEMGERLARPVIVAGPGQNGGDAWVVGRHLIIAGYRPRAFLLSRKSKVKGDAEANLEALEALGVEVEELPDDDLSPLEAALDEATLIVDGIFGTGLSREVEGRFAAALSAMSSAEAPIFALDLPSGIDADRGTVWGIAPRASLTVTFGSLKRGLCTHPGREHAGEVRVVHIGVPLPYLAQVGVIEATDVAAWLPKRPRDDHKGRAGHVLLVVGAPGTTGAALLSGRGALRGGAGLATVAAPEITCSALDGRLPELMTTSLGEGTDRHAILAAFEGKDAGVVGCGVGMGDEDRRRSLIAALEADLPCVLDADALNAIAAGPGLEALADAPAARVLTPHPKEAARLLGVETKEIQGDRFAAALELANRSKQVAVLKGAGTVVASPDGRMGVCLRGTPAMGVGGTGDVLSGALGAQLARLEPFEAACAGVMLHAVAGERASRADRGLLASDLADALPDALEALR